MTNETSYRRGSVFGALLLIAVGSLFLYANLHPEFSPWPVLAKYWPVLIIFWGLSRLADYLMLRGTPQAASVTRLSAGDIIGILFILIFGTLFTQAVRYGLGRDHPPWFGGNEFPCVLGTEYQFSDEIRQKIEAPGTLYLRNLRGNLTLAPAAGDEALVLARKTVCAASESEARAMASNVRLAWQSVADGYEFRWDPGQTTGWLRADLEVQVPPRVNLNLASTRGDTKLSGVAGNVELNLERGDAILNNIEGDVQLRIRRGDVQLADVRGSATIEGSGYEIEAHDIGGQLTLRGEYRGPLRFARIGGPTRFESNRTTFSAARIEGDLTTSGGFRLRGVPGDVRLLTKDYEIEMENIGGEIFIENRNGPVRIRLARPPSDPISIETRSGDIELILPAASGFEISATARDGRIDSDFGGPNLKLEGEDTDAPALTGTYGDGRTRIRLSTTHGTIHLRRQ